MKHHNEAKFTELLAAAEKIRAGASCPDKQTHERDRWMRLMKMTIIPVAVAALAAFVGGYNSRAPNHPADIAVAQSPEVRRAIPVEIRRAIPVEPGIRKAIPVRQFQVKESMRRTFLVVRGGENRFQGVAAAEFA